MSRSQMIHSSVVFLSLCFGSITAASTIELQVTGEITSSTFASVPVGTTLTADLFYDPSTAASVSTPSNAQYPLPQQPFLDFAGSTLTFPGSSVVTTLIDLGGCPLFQRSVNGQLPIFIPLKL